LVGWSHVKCNQTAEGVPLVGNSVLSGGLASSKPHYKLGTWNIFGFLITPQCMCCPPRATVMVVDYECSTVPMVFSYKLSKLHILFFRPPNCWYRCVMFEHRCPVVVTLA